MTLSIFGLLWTVKYEYNRQYYQWFYLQLDSLLLKVLHHLFMLVEIMDTQVQLWLQDFSKFIEEERATDNSRTASRVCGQVQKTCLVSLEDFSPLRQHQSVYSLMLFSCLDNIHVEAMDILKRFVEHSPRPLSNPFIKSSFPASGCYILSSFDRHILLRGGPSSIPIGCH